MSAPLGWFSPHLNLKSWFDPHLFTQTITLTDPSTIFGANLVAWYKADVGLTLAGSAVTGWADQSGNSRNLTVYSGGPTYSATGFNGGPGVVLDNPNMDGFISSAFNIATRTASFFMVLNVGSSGGDKRILAYSSNVVADYGNAISVLALNSNAGNSLNAYHNSTASTAQTLTDNTNYRVGSIYDGPNTSLTTYVNNVAGTPAAPSNDVLGSAATSLFIGKNNDGSGAGLTVAEIVMTDSVASSGDRSSLDDYFQTKWGL